MKFKKVEISAFRIYDNPANATFDFSTKSGETANFISLYAPNGFGKTSFYDAVEWGMTKSVNRFYIRSKELEKLADYQFQENELPLIQNSKSERETYVKIYFDEDKNPVQNSFKKHGKQKHDLNFDKPIVHEFQKVILSQEWISAFLTESNGETRYRKFMENPELSNISNYYNNLKHQSSIYKEIIEDNESEITRLRNVIKNEGNESLLLNINSQIDLLINSFEQSKLNRITLSTTKENIKEFRDLISERIIVFDRKSKIASILLDDITLARIGNENITGVNLFYERSQVLNNSILRLKEIETNLKGFDDLEKAINELSNNKQSIVRYTENIENTNKIILLFEEYQLVKNDIERKSNLLKDNETNLSGLSIQSETEVINHINYKNQLDTVIKEIETVEKNISLLPLLKENITKTTNEIISVEKFINEAKPKISTSERNISLLEIEINELKLITEEIRLKQYSSSSLAKNQELTNLIQELETKHNNTLIEKDKLKVLELKIEQQQSLNSTIQEFIQSGLTIVNAQQTSNCPLCENIYNSYNELAERISNNKSLSKILQDLLSERSIALSQISALEEEVKISNEILIEYYNKQVIDRDASKKIIQKELASIRKNIQIKETELKSLKVKQTDNLIQVNGLSVEEYEIDLRNSLTVNIDKKTLLAQTVFKIQTQIDQINEKIKIYKDQVILYEKEIKELYENDKYKTVTTWFNENYPNQEKDLKLLKEQLKSLSDNVDNHSSKIKSLESTVESIRKDLNLYTKEGLMQQENEWKQKKLETEHKTNAYKNFLKEKLEIELLNLDKDVLSQVIEKKESEYKLELKKNKDLNDEYLKLEKYSENIVDFLQSENAKLELKAKEDNLQFLVNKVKFLIDGETIKTKQHIQDKVKEFFYEDLINDLYKKIDPHPDFKEVHFKVNLDADPPRLDVFVKNKNNKDTLIPNLYFSTAQINILSLSIFLASAMNSEDYDCIFIDDPVQSLDSVNLLSTIDLLRSIIVNFNKQIILSTHDENFHNLLKKKMPPSLFKSKFLELDTFGKVKVDVN